ncbi:MAG: hypothetical protein RL295_2151 [Pseudomonadota bacterium]|jgi:hemolysin activation/secretion protein
MTHARTCYLALGLFTAVSVSAQTPPGVDAGALMRQTEQNIRQSQLQQAAKKRDSLPPAAVLTDTTVVTAERFKFLGNQRLSTEQLQTAAAPFANRPLNQHDVHHLTDAISQEYRKAGWLVQAYIPRQNLAGPELVIQVIESIPPNKP